MLVELFKGDVTRDDSQRRFLAQQSVATLLRHCFGCYNIVPTWQRCVDMLCHVTGLEDTPYNHGSMFLAGLEVAWASG